MPIVRDIVPVYGTESWMAPNIVFMGDNKWVKVEEDPSAPRPPKPVDAAFKRPTTSILVSIAALRETRCPETLRSIFGNASNPERVRVSLVQQNSAGDPDCLALACEARGAPLVQNTSGGWENPHGCNIFDRVRVLRMSTDEAKGPLYARALGHTLLRDDDEFCLQIDAHTIFGNAWDREMLLEWGATENEFAILSTYPTGNSDPYVNVNRHWEMPHLCAARFLRAGVVRNSIAKAAANLERPLLAPLWAAGLSFGRCHADRLVPQNLPLPPPCPVAALPLPIPHFPIPRAHPTPHHPRHTPQVTRLPKPSHRPYRHPTPPPP